MALAACLIASAAAAVARAEEAPFPTPAAEPSEDPPPVGRFQIAPNGDPQWYGGLVLLTDLASDLGTIVLPPAGLAGMAFGAPAIHASHGRWGVAAGSFALRVGAMLWVVAAAMPSDECEHGMGGCRSIFEIIGPLVAVQALDAAFFSWAPSETRRASAPSLLPAVAAREGGGTLSLSGRF
jgi:hypothetical protein